MRSSACATGLRRCQGNSPAVRPHTGSIQGSPSARSAGTIWSGCTIWRRSSNRPDTSTRPPFGSFAAGKRWKNTRSANPLPSVTTALVGWRALPGGSMRTTSTSIVASAPGTASAIVVRVRRSIQLSGRWNSRSITRVPPAARAISAATVSPTPRRAVSGSNSGAHRLAGIGDGVGGGMG